MNLTGKNSKFRAAAFFTWKGQMCGACFYFHRDITHWNLRSKDRRDKKLEKVNITPCGGKNECF